MANSLCWRLQRLVIEITRIRHKLQNIEEEEHCYFIVRGQCFPVTNARHRPGHPPRASWSSSGAGTASRVRLSHLPHRTRPQMLLPSQSPVQGAGGGACPSEGGLEIPDTDQGLTGGCVEERPGDLRFSTLPQPRGQRVGECGVRGSVGSGSPEGSATLPPSEAS